MNLGETDNSREEETLAVKTQPQETKLQATSHLGTSLTTISTTHVSDQEPTKEIRQTLPYVNSKTDDGDNKSAAPSPNPFGPLKYDIDKASRILAMRREIVRQILSRARGGENNLNHGQASSSLLVDFKVRSTFRP